MIEVWKDIPGYEGNYQASNLGRIRSIKKEPVILKGDLQRNGYRRVYLWMGNGKKNCMVHRLIAETFLDNPLMLSDINHIDEDKTNNRVDNLEWCTHRYNMNYGHVRTKISIANRGKTVTEATKQKLREDTSRRRWIHDGTVERYVYVEELFLFLSAGWQKGRIKKEA